MGTRPRIGSTSKAVSDRLRLTPDEVPSRVPVGGLDAERNEPDIKLELELELELELKLGLELELELELGLGLGLELDVKPGALAVEFAELAELAELVALAELKKLLEELDEELVARLSC
jgi:hypothetical protein